jgi:iron complex transport system substrate-binding protein
VAGLVTAALLASGCGQRSEPTGELPAEYPVTVQGAGDAPLELDQAPKRIVALDAGSAELIDALGAGGTLVGVPAGATLQGGARPAEVVPASGEIDVDAVVALEPDLLVATVDTDRVAVSQIERQTGAPLYVQPSRTVDDLLEAVLELGFVLGHPVEARRLSGQLQRGVAEIEERLTDVDSVRVFVDTGLFVTVGDESILGDLLRRAKGENVAPDPDLGPASAEDLAAADPDIYLATSDSDRTLESLARDPETKDLRAVREGRVVILPVDVVLEPGAEIVEALRTVAVALHPDAFQ